MIFHATPIEGARLVSIERHADERGFFARTWCKDEFARAGIDVDMPQSSVSRNAVAGTLRGLHFTWPPSREAKLVRCGRGRIFDVILDLRPRSPTYLRHHAVELDDQRLDALFVPAGVAHGFQTLADECDVVYQMTEEHRPGLGAGVRYDDPAFAIAWPAPVRVIAGRDRGYPDFDAARHAARYDEARAHDAGGGPT